jgi:hypothetical protein
MGTGEAPQKSLSELQREAVELDVKLKQLDLEQKEREFTEKSGFLYRFIRNPAIITALITVGIPALVALATVINGSISAKQQRNADDIKYGQETNKSILLGIINSGDPYSIAGKLKIFLDTKLILDDSESSFHQVEQTLEGQPLRDILSNILRASDNQPLQFSSTLSQDFYPRLRRPIELRDLSYFIRLGFPRELLFRLFADYVSFTPRDDPQRRGSFILYNKAQGGGCIVSRPTVSETKESAQHQLCFQDFISFSELSGLSLEIKRTSISKSEVGATGSAPEARLCFNVALANFAKADYALVHPDDPLMFSFLKSISLAEYHPICGETLALDSWSGASTKGQGAASDLQALSVKVSNPTGRLFWDVGGLATMELGTRSTGAVYNFLGQLMLHQDGVANLLIGTLEPDEDPQMLTIIKGKSPGCFVSVPYGDGVYCVPAVGAANTKRIFALLAQLPPE